MHAASLDQARDILRRTFGYPDFRPGQVDVVRAVLDGGDTLAVLPTGGGKSLCYQVPALARPGLTLVVSPLISLMKDQVDRLLARGVSATFLNSSLDDDEAAARAAAVRAGRVKLLYVAPERLQSTDLLRGLGDSHVTLLAVDEAHCISEWGHEFRPSYRRIADAHSRLGEPQVAALTATATPAVRRDIAAQLRLRTPRVIVGGFDRPRLHYVVHICESQALKDEALVRVVRARNGPAIVYAPTRAAVERLAKRLARAGARSRPYHGGLHESMRREAQDAFMAGEVDVIAATNAFGMGIDRPDVRLVVHHAMPGTLEAYYQEAGRAGRDGDPATCALLHHAADRLTHEWFIRGTFPPRSAVEQVVAFLSHEASRGGIVPDDPARIARACRHVDPRLARAVLGFLEREGAVRRPADGTELWVRLLATPARIRGELGADAVEIGVLRGLWRVGREALQQGLIVDLARLPRPLTVRRARRLLERLRDRQFVDISVTAPGLRVGGNGTIDVDALDWSRIRQRRESELHKLDMMEHYARATTCRRAFLLGYFGERSDKPQCNGCDNCQARMG